MLVVHRYCTGTALVLYWCGIGTVLLRYCYGTGNVLALCWGCTGTVLLWYLYSPTLYRYCTGVVLMCGGARLALYSHHIALAPAPRRYRTDIVLVFVVVRWYWVGTLLTPGCFFLRAALALA